MLRLTNKRESEWTTILIILQKNDSIFSMQNNNKFKPNFRRLKKVKYKFIILLTPIHFLLINHVHYNPYPHVLRN